MVSDVRKRRGSLVLEATLGLPLLFIIVFAGLEFAWAFSKKVEVTNAARVAARTASLAHSTSMDVYAATSSQMAAAGFGLGDWDLELDPTNPAAATPGSPVSVVIRANYSAVSLGGLSDWFPLPDQISSAAVMRKEGNP